MMLAEQTEDNDILFKLISNEIIFDEIKIQEAWRQIVERRLSSVVPESKSETFIRSAILFYARSPSVVRVTADVIIAKSGFSRSSFFRVFSSYTDFQIKMYRYLCVIAAMEYLSIINRRQLNPGQLADITLSVIYSSNIAIPNSHFLNMVRGAPELKYTDFNQATPIIAAGLHEYIEKHRHLGYACVSLSELQGLLDTLDFDIFNQRVSPSGGFPSAEQARRLRKLFLGFISDN
jgi:AraC-like DNA-binding protein